MTRNIQREETNHRLDCEIERLIDIWEGTYYGLQLKNMYENGTSYESICDFLDIDYSEYTDDSYSM